MKSQGETTKKVDKIVKVTKDFISSGIGLKKLKSISSIDDYDVIVKNKVQNKTYLIDSSLLGGSGIQTIAEGTNITVDNTDPLNPIVSASSSLFPNGQEIVTESRDFRDSDIGKILIVVGNDITLTMPDSIVFSEQLRTIGLVFLKGYTGCGYQPSHGFTTKVLQLPNDGEFITLITGEYLGKSSVGSIANMQVNSDGEIVTLNKYLYDKSQSLADIAGKIIDLGSITYADVNAIPVNEIIEFFVNDSIPIDYYVEKLFVNTITTFDGILSGATIEIDSAGSLFDNWEVNTSGKKIYNNNAGGSFVYDISNGTNTIRLSFNIANEADNGITQGEIIVKALIRKFPN